jgi:hypothetical protein
VSSAAVTITATSTATPMAPDGFSPLGFHIPLLFRARRYRYANTKPMNCAMMIRRGTMARAFFALSIM